MTRAAVVSSTSTRRFATPRMRCGHATSRSTRTCRRNEKVICFTPAARAAARRRWPVGVEVHLPVVIVVAERPDAENDTRLVERQDLDERFRIVDHVRNRAQPGAQPGDGHLHVGGRWHVGRQIDPPERVRAEVLEIVREQFVVADEGQDVVLSVDHRHEQTDLANGSRHACRGNRVADLERPKRQEEESRGEVREQSRPCRADRDAGRRQQGGERRRLHAEHAEYRRSAREAEARRWPPYPCRWRGSRRAAGCA